MGVSEEFLEGCQVKSGHIPMMFKKAAGEQFIGIPETALYGAGLDVYQFRLYLQLLAHVGSGDKPNVSELSYAALSDLTGISLAKVRKTIQELEELKLVSVQRRTGKDGGNLTNEYTIYYPRVMRCAEMG